MSHIHDVFHVSSLRGYNNHPLHVIDYPLDQLVVDLSYKEEPEQVLDRTVKILWNRSIPYVKVQWRHRDLRGETWESKDRICREYPDF